MTPFAVIFVLSCIYAAGSSFSFNSYNQTELLRIYYISFSASNSDIRTSSFNYSFSKQNLSIASSADDSPFDNLVLSLDKFVLFGQKTGRLYVNPNGALHISYVQPCPYDNIFGATPKPFDDTYFGVIGGILTDLNPGNSTSGSISSITALRTSNGLDYVSVKYDRVAYYGSAKELTFRIVLFEDSSISIKYDSVYHDSSLPSGTMWSSGLRPPKINNLTYIDPDQAAYGVSQWGTKVSGVYPPQETIFNQQQFTMCPVSLSWCVTPSQLLTSHTTATVTLTTLLLSCTDLLDYGIVLSLFVPEAGSTIAGNNQYVVKCTADTSTGPDTFQQMTCVIPASLTTDATDYFVIPIWRVKTSSASAVYTVLPVGSMTVTFVDGSPEADQCYFNGQTYDYSPSVCSDCEICNFDTTCLDLPCTPEDPVLYEWPSCNSTCAGTNTTANSTYLVDPNHVCCSLEDMDCGGICHGTQKVGWQDSDSIICCPRGKTVDCAGICAGNTPVDACGECKGRDYTGVTCFAFDRVYVTTGTPNNTFNAVFDTSLAGAPLTFYVNITNESNATVMFDFTIKDEVKAQAPNITLPPIYTLQINESVWNIPIQVSLTELFQGNQTEWAVKTIRVNYYRQVFPSHLYPVDILVLPSTTGCDTITDSVVVSPKDSVGQSEASLCLRLPACMYCLVNGNVRILRENDEDTTATSVARRLFVYLLPDYARNNDDHLLDGYCTNGWSTDVCSDSMAALDNAGSATLNMHLWWLYAIICILFIVLM